MGLDISFLWYNPQERFLVKDGLYRALEILEQDHNIEYYFRPDRPDIGRKIGSPDVILCWAPLIEFWLPNIEHLDIPKALLFAGGDPHKKERAGMFDVIFVESEEWERRVPHSNVVRAFGTNTELFRPMQLEKKWRGIYPATFALWKRHDMFAEALGEKGLAVGEKQDHEPQCWKVCEEHGVEIQESTSSEELVNLYNQSDFTVITSDKWGGSQRPCLESMSCDVPVITMSDSKAAEFVKESGFGIVCDTQEELNYAVEEAPSQFSGGRDYIMSKWTEYHYAKSIQDNLTSF